MSGRIVGQVFDCAPEDLTPAQLLVLLSVAEDAREKSRLATFSDVESLVRRTRLKRGTIDNALSVLCQRGLLIRQREKVHRGGYHQEYVVAHLAPHHRAVTAERSSPSERLTSLGSEALPCGKVRGASLNGSLNGSMDGSRRGEPTP